MEIVERIWYRRISDFSDRNFLLVDGRVISIDEDIELKDVNIYKELRKNKDDYVYKWLKKNYDKIDKIWVNISSNKEEKKRLEYLKNKEKVLAMFKE